MDRVKDNERCLHSLQKACPQSIRVAALVDTSSRHVPHLTNRLVSSATGAADFVSGGGKPASKNIGAVPFSARAQNRFSTFQR
jgi:hypothetical protein